MCGIFGVIIGKSAKVSELDVTESIGKLFKLSESRGKEAAGLCIYSKEKISIFKQPLPASKMIKTKGYKEFYRNVFGETVSPESCHPIAIIGHSRLVTNGFETASSNNQPVLYNDTVGVHNGIIVNDSELWMENGDIERHCEVDTEIIMALLDKYLSQGESLERSATKLFNAIDGAASIAIFNKNNDEILFATNTGSLYFIHDHISKVSIFASESLILENFKDKFKNKLISSSSVIIRIAPRTGVIFDRFSHVYRNINFEIENPQNFEQIGSACSRTSIEIVDTTSTDSPATIFLKRCKKCILPETMPFIKFDSDGVCNFCNNYKPLEYLGEDALEKYVAPFRKKNGEPDILIAFSGGRDSSYTLQYFKNVLKMNPIAYTYDWGMVTDIARRNQSRITGKLGIEHIIISADIKKKRRHIKKNVEAWMKNPHLGMVPLFMAGDKQFFYYANLLKKKLHIAPPVVFSMNYLEKTSFKTGFCGIDEGVHKDRHYAMSMAKTMNLALFYAKQYLSNPSYLNESFVDSLLSFFSYYIMPQEYLHFFKYIPWDEDKINQTLIREFDWEVASDTKSTWRIGDGTTSFYNYIYCTVAGFTENDTFYSNMIREGTISRQKALDIVSENNITRWKSMREYARIVGFDIDSAIATINRMEKLYPVVPRMS